MSKGEIISTSLWADIMSVATTTDKSRIQKQTATIHTEKEDFSPMKILLVENVRDYARMSSESRHIRVMMAFGDYVYRVCPFKDNLEISIKTAYFFEGGGVNTKMPPKEIRYKAILDTTKNPFFGSQSLINKPNNELNLLPPLEIVFEVIDRRAEVLRLKNVSGVFSNVTAEQILRGVFFHEANKAKVDGKPILAAIDMDPPDNKEVIPDLLLHNDLLLRDLPGYMQDKGFGVYAAGIGGFFQVYKDLPTWFTFPVYRPDRFDDDRARLIIYAVPEERMPSHDHTYRTEGKITYIITTGEKVEADAARISELNSGVGFRMSNTESFMSKPVEITETGIKANRNRLNYEVQDHNRKDQMLYAPMKEAKSSPFVEYSRVLSQSLTGLTVSWQNSDPDLLYPGMPVKYVTMDKGKYTERKGTLIRAVNVTAIQGNPTVDTIHRCNTQLYMTLEYKDIFPDNDPTSAVGEQY